MKQLLTLLTLALFASCGQQEENIIRVQFTDINGKVFDTNEKHGECIKINTGGGLFVIERVQEDGSRSRFEFKGDLTSHTKKGNQDIYWAKSHHSESTDKFILFGVDKDMLTVDSIYQDYGEDYHVPQARLVKFFGDLRWDKENE